MRQIDKILIIMLSSLVVLDFTTTIIAVGYLGAVELNPMVSLGFTEFMIIKLIVTVLCMLILIHVNTVLKTPCLCILVIFYGVIIISNIDQLINTIYLLI